MPDTFAHPTPAEASPRDVRHLLDLLEVEELDVDLYRAQNPADETRPNLFGGQVLAQSVRAASLTVPDGRMLHSLHGYFLRPGTTRPTLLHVDRDRDGRSFSARRVVARQNGQAIYTMLASFHVAQAGDEHSELEMPIGTPQPDDMPEGQFFGFGGMFDLRAIVERDPSGQWVPTHRYWARTRGPMPDDPQLNQCVLAFLSDIGTGHYRVPGGTPKGGPSLDHAMWFHDPSVRLDEWVLFDLSAVRLARGRGYYTGAMFSLDGRLVASLAQEHLWRDRRDVAPPV